MLMQIVRLLGLSILYLVRNRKAKSMSEFMGDPALTLETMEDVRQWLVNPISYNDTRVKWLIKSPWIIGLIGEIEASGKYPYNAEVKWMVEERLGLPCGRATNDTREGTPISTLVYNAQNYRRSDAMLAAGFVPGSDDMLVAAFESNRKIETAGGNVLTVKEIDGKLYALKPYKRKWAVQIIGVPCRLAQ